MTLNDLNTLKASIPARRALVDAAQAVLNIEIQALAHAEALAAQTDASQLTDPGQQEIFWEITSELAKVRTS